MKKEATPETMGDVFAQTLSNLAFCFNAKHPVYCGKNSKSWMKASPRERMRIALIEVAEGLRHA